MVGQNPSADCSIIFVDDQAVAIDRVDFRMAVEKVRYMSKSAREQNIVCIQPCEYLRVAGVLKASIDRISLSGVGFYAN